MAGPETPPMTPVRPTMRNLELWTGGYNHATLDWRETIQDIVDGLKTTLKDPFQPDEARIGAVFLIGQAYETTARELGFDITVFRTNLATALRSNTQDNDADFIDDSEQQPGGLNSQTITQNFRAGDAAVEAGRAGLTANSETIAANAWDSELERDGKQQGSGDDLETPKYVGGTWMQKAPKIITVKMDIMTIDGELLTKERIEEIQGLLWEELTKLTYVGRIDQSRKFLKLHPWAIATWVNILTGLILGGVGIKHLNDVFTAFIKESKAGVSWKDVERARLLAADPTLTNEERAMYASMALAIVDDLTSSNAYTKFKSLYEGCAFVVKFGYLLDAMLNGAGNPEKQNLARSIEHQAAALGEAGRGKQTRHQLMVVVAHQMQWTVTKFGDFYDKFAALGLLTSAYGGVFVLLVDKNIQSILRKNVQGSIPEVLKIADRVFPQLKTICQAIHDLVMEDLLSTDSARTAKIASYRIDGSSGDASMIERIRAARAD